QKPLLILLITLVSLAALLTAEEKEELIFNNGGGGGDVNLNVSSGVSNSNRSKEDSFAGMLDRALEKEFPESDDDQSD
ncbi:hypothetical protein Tco_0634143, partial [Tanacetum coccineum]